MGDCRDVLPDFPKKSVDLIYLDPPFFSNKDYEVIWEDGAEKRAFKDRWKGGIHTYIDWMKKRLRSMKSVLKETGSLYLHCDWHADSYLRIMLDDVFGYDNLLSKVVWQRTKTKSTTSKFKNDYDTILLYTKTDDFVFNTQYESIKKTDKLKEDETGLYKDQPVIQKGDNKGDNKRYFKGKDTTVTLDDEHKWLATQEKIDSNKFYWTSNDNPRIKRYLEKGKPCGSIWLDMIIHNSSSERLGYPTQKPKELLRRIIKTSSNKGDVVLDPFCGCGTTIAAAKELDRDWIGIDVSPTACSVMRKRIRDKYNKTPKISGIPNTPKDLKKIEHFEFQNWVVRAFDGKVKGKKSSDMGIDGYTDTRNPIQVKQSEKVGRNVVDNFQTAVRREDSDKGIIVAFSFTSGAWEEEARVKDEGNIEIELKTVEDLIEERPEDDIPSMFIKDDEVSE